MSGTDLFTPPLSPAVEQLIEERAAEAHAEITRMAASAREEVSRRAAFLKRSHGQRKRWWRAKNLRGERA